MSLSLEQTRAIYSLKRNAYASKRRKEEKEKQDNERRIWQKKQNDNAKAVAALQGLNMLKQLKESRQQKLLNINAKDPVTGEIMVDSKTGMPIKKYIFKQDRSYKDFLKDPKKEIGESFKRILPKGELEANPALLKRNKEIALEKIGETTSGVDRESLIGAIDPATGEQMTGEAYDALIKQRQEQWNLSEGILDPETLPDPDKVAKGREVMEAELAKYKSSADKQAKIEAERIAKSDAWNAEQNEAALKALQEEAGTLAPVIDHEKIETAM